VRVVANPAIDVAIHAAIVGGLISGAVILVGVLVAEWLTRSRDRTYAIRAATTSVVRQLPIALAYMSTSPPTDQRVAFGTDGWDVYQAVQASLNEIDIATRRRGVRNRKKVREAHEEVSARFAAAYFRCVSRNEYVTAEERYNFQTEMLNRAVFGERENFDEKFKQYLNEGFPDSSPDG
jgi:hypothetical protein